MRGFNELVKTVSIVTCFKHSLRLRRAEIGRKPEEERERERMSHQTSRLLSGRTITKLIQAVRNGVGHFCYAVQFYVHLWLDVLGIFAFLLRADAAMSRGACNVKN